MTNIIPINNETSPLREEIDIAVNTAKAYPRCVDVVLNEIKSQISLSQEIAKSMWYALPRKEQGGKTITIEGPSIRLAELFLSNWGNLRVQSRIKEIGDTHVIAEAIVYDMEKNVAVCKEARRRITNRDGLRYSDDMILNTANACISIAIRNALFTIIPRAFVDNVLAFSKDIAVRHPSDKGRSLAQRFDDAVSKFAKFGLTKDNLLAHLHIKDEKEFTEKHLQYLWGVFNALENGEIKPDEIKQQTVEL